MSLAFDLLLVAALLWSAWRTLATPDLTRAVVMFIVFGLLMALAWARLAAPDIAIAEAAIGAGLTGALLLDAVGALGERPDRGGPHPAVLILALPPAVLVVLALADLPAPAVDLPGAVAGQMAQSGVDHPVTAVLLNFRGYDTLLEVAVLLVALLGMLVVAGERRGGGGVLSTEPLVSALARLLVPLMVLVAGYLLWAGAHRPGGAFQAGAVLAAAAVLLHLAGLLPAWGRPALALRVGLAAGFAIFLAVAVGLLAAGGLLLYPPALAGALILLVEAALTLSLGLVLAALFLFLTAPEGGR